MTVERGTRDVATADSSCGSFVAGGQVYKGELRDFPTSPAGALSDGGGVLAVGTERAYRVTWRLQDNEAAEGQSVSGVTFRWETTTAG
jgi:hypothetical protein